MKSHRLIISLIAAVSALAIFTQVYAQEPQPSLPPPLEEMVARSVPALIPPPNITMLTDPAKLSAPLYADLNNNGIQEAGEFVGRYPFFNWNEAVVFQWEALAHEPFFPTASYRVSLWQYPPGTAVAYPGQWREIKVSHHWASNPNGREFVLNSFGFDETLCFSCLTYIIIQPEVYTTVFNQGGAVEYRYSRVFPPEAAIGDAVAVSAPFVLERFPRQ